MDATKGVIFVDHHRTYEQKKAKGFQWAKDAFDVYDQCMGVTRDDARRMQIKYMLSNGEMPRLNPQDWGLLNIKLNPQYSKKDWQKVPHIPVIDTLYNLMVGERQRQVFEPMAFDIGLFSRSEKSRMHLMYIQKYLQRTIWEPYKAEVTQRVMMESGVNSPTELGSDDQQQMMSDINKRLLEMTPDKINEYFAKEYYSPFSEQAQMLLEYEKKTKNLKHHFEERFKHGYISNTEVSYIYESHGNPRIDLCNSAGISWDGGSDVNFVEDGDFCKYETYRGYMEIYTRYGEKIKLEDVEKIEAGYNFSQDRNYYKSPMTPMMESELIGFYSDNRQMFPNGIDQNTMEGQSMLLALKAKFHRGHTLVGEKIRDCHIAFRTPVLLKHVKREVNERIEYSWRDHDYVLNPDHGDISETVIRSTEVWGARMLGHQTKGVYVDVGPLKYQWADIDDPRKKKLPYYGIFYNKLMENAPMRGGFDKGVPHQIEYNIQSARLEEEKGHNIGKLFSMFMSAKPSEYSWDEYVDLIKGTRIIPIDETKLMGNAASIAMATGGHAFKAVDLTNQPAINDAITQLDIIYRNMMRSMSINPERDGSSSPYMSIQNNKQNLINSGNKTLDIYTIHNIGINNTLQGYMEFCHYVYGKNPKPLIWIADDMSIAELRLTDDFISYGKVGVFFTNDPEDQRSMDEIKAETMHLIQNDSFDLIPFLARLKFARTPAAMLNIADRFAQKMEEKMAAAQKAQKESIQQQMELQQQDKERMYGHEKELSDDKLQNTLAITAINRDQFSDATDQNENNQNDLNERDRERTRYEKQRDDADRALKKDLEMRKIEASLESARLKKRDAATKKK